MSHKSLFLLLLLLLLLLLHLGDSQPTSETTAFTTFRSSLHGNWNKTQSPIPPCKWSGILCSSNHITIINLPSFNLTGTIPFHTIGSLTHLQTLSLPFNSLTGQLPSDLSNCTNLRNLSLQGNHFSGNIPPFIFKLHNLVHLNLAGNNLSGTLSPSFNDLQRLGSLFLDKNQLTGPIPELKLPNLVQFNVSFNRLNGSIPLQLQSKNATCFQGNSLCGEPIGPCPDTKNTTTQEENTSTLLLCDGSVNDNVLVYGFIVILLILAYLLCWNKGLWQSNNRFDSNKQKEVSSPNDDDEEEEEEKSVMESQVSRKKLVFFVRGGKEFELEELLESSGEELGNGMNGTTYKADLSNGNVVVVKRLNKGVVICEKGFQEMVESVGSMDHDNLVPLRAYYYSTDEKLLVYDYLPMGSLSAVLHGIREGGRSPLSWKTRFSIALGAARGIEYLHSRRPSISHGNIKSSNILLTKSCNARVADFGFSRLNGTSSSPNRDGGNQAPEITDVRAVSHEADVYSFGVLLLELLTGKAPAHELLNEEGVDIATWVKSVVKEWNSEMFDLEQQRYLDVEEDTTQLLQLAIHCISHYPDKRPTMLEVVRRIEELCHSASSSRQLQDPQSDLFDLELQRHL